MQYTGKQLNDLINNQSRNSLKWYVKNRKDVYRDDWDYIIFNEIKRQFLQKDYKDLRLLETKELNLLKRVIREISMIYKNPAERKAIINDDTENEIEDEVYSDILKYCNMDILMKEVNRYTNLLNNCILHIAWRNEKIDYDILTFDNCEILTDPEDWKNIIAIKYYIGLQLPYRDDFNYVTQDGKVGDTQIVMPQSSTLQDWDEYTYSYLYTIESDNSYIYKYQMDGSSEKLIEKLDNPYRDTFGNPVLPFVLFSKNYPIDNLLDYTSGSDLFDLTLSTAISLIHLNNLQKFSSWKQIYMLVENPSAIPEGIGLSPNKVMVGKLSKDGNGSIGVLDMQSNIKGFWDVILERIRVGIAQYGMDAESFQRTGNESGIKLIIKKEGLIEIREDQLPLYREYEKDLFEKTRIVNNFHNSKLINENAEFCINFGELKFQTDKEAEARTWVIKITNNVATPVDWIKTEDPDLDDDEALKKYLDNKNINGNGKGNVILNKPVNPQMNEEVKINNEEINNEEKNAI